MKEEDKPKIEEILNNNLHNLEKVVEKKVIFARYTILLNRRLNSPLILSKKDSKVNKKGVKAEKIDDFDFENLVIDDGS